jgi:DNA replication and repair protein RecF
VEQDFLKVWISYRRNLLQRNSALKKRYPKEYCAAWNDKLSDTAEKITALRTNYLTMLEPYLTYYASFFGNPVSLSLNYKKGWPRDNSLKTLLSLRSSDYSEKYPTPVGPHLADLEILLDGRPLRETASRGQQKMFSSMLKLAQLKLLKEKTGKSALFLIDDLCSELDNGNRDKLFAAILDLDVQTFISVLALNLLELDIPCEYELFHVEHGRMLNLN